MGNRGGGSGPSRGGGGYGGVPPPKSFHPNSSSSMPGGVNKQGYSTINAISVGMMSQEANNEIIVRKARTEDDYFNEDDDDTDYRIGSKPKPKPKDYDEELPYQPAPGSPGPPEAKQSKPAESSDSEEDPLDAFMANLEKDAKKQGVKAVDKKSAETKPESSKKGVRQDIDEADNEESYYKWLEENPNAGRNVDDEDDLGIEYDEDGNPMVPMKSKHIDPLASLDHTQIEYKPFERSFYTEHPDIAGLSPIQVIDLQQKLGTRVSGASPPKPVSSFANFSFDEALLKAIRKSEFSQPTPIQSQGIPALLSGRDCIGIAKTGSGKTAAFLWPMLTHIMAQPRLLKGDGPIGLVLVPTRELAMQIYTEAKKFGRVFDLQVVCAYGGGSKWEQSKGFEAGAEIAIATPGRMIDMVKMKVTNLQRVTYLVLDEADRMFDMGFEPQVF
jgi:ATP-dependent RNA helicase DDX42